ncbi:MAG: CotH kinase family protein [Christensenellales bacterium]
MKKLRKYLLAFALSAISVISLVCVNALDSNKTNRNNVYALSGNVVYDNFDLESSTSGITSDCDSGWKTFDDRNASLFFSNDETITEEGIFFELNSNARNSYYRNVSLAENEEYNFSLEHRGRFGADTIALIIGKVQYNDSSEIVTPSINSSNLDQFMQMSDWLVSNNYLTAKIGVDPQIILYSKKFSTAGGFVGDSETNFSLEQTEDFTEKWTVIFITTNYYNWVEHNYVYTPEQSTDYIVSLTHVKSRGKNAKDQNASVGEGNLIRSFSITNNSTDTVIYSCDESILTESTKTIISNKGYTSINSANNSSPYSIDLWNVTESSLAIEVGRASFDAYKISNLSQITPVEGGAFLLSQGVYKDFDFSDLTSDFFNVTYSDISRYQQLFRIIALPKEVQITTNDSTFISQIDYIEQYINADASLNNASKITLYTSNFDANGSFALPLSEAFSLKKDSKHQIKVDIYNLYSSTSWSEINVVFDNTEGTYDNGIKICFGGCGLDQVASIFFDAITVESCTLSDTFGGDGSRGFPYRIQSSEDFALFRKILLSGRALSGKYFEQTADLDFTNTKLDCIIGTSPSFAGNYNGKGYTLSNITMDYSNYTSITNTRSSIFFNVSGSIINLSLEDSSFLGHYVSTFADSLNGYGNISNCYANNITLGGTGTTWGACIALIVTGNATLENIYFNGTLTGPSDTNNYGVASYRSKTCSLTNIFTTSTKLLQAVSVTAREFTNCAIKTEEELKSEEVLELLNSYASTYGFNAWQTGTNSFPVITQQIAGISLKSFSVTDTTIQENINCYYSPEVGEYYLLLPNYFDIEHIIVSYTILTEDISNAYLKIYNIDDSNNIDYDSEIEIIQGASYDFSNLNRFKVKVGNSSMSKDYIFNLMQGGNASIFISLTNGNLDFSNINMDSNHNTGSTGVAKIVDYDGNIESQQIKEMRGRGNYSWGLSKKPYQIKFKNSFSMLGMKESKTWLLIANHTDGSLARTATWYELATWFGIDYSVEFEVANVYINGNYNGMYLVTSKVQVDENRINVSDDDYLIEIDNTVDDYQFMTDYNTVVKFTIKNPDLDDITIEERTNKIAEIKAYIDFIESKIYDQSVKFEELSTYLDMESFAKYYWIQELSLNFDAMYGSSYMYTTTDAETGAKTLHMGPIWDMDNTIGFYAKILADYANLKYYNLLNDSFGAVGKRVVWYNQLMQRQEFSDLIDEVFIRNYKTALSYSENEDDSYSGIVGYVAKYLEDTHDSALMNYSRWNYSTMKSEQTYWMGGENYPEACTNLINYLKARIDFYYGEYRNIMYKSIMIEYVDKDGFNSALTRDINNIDKIIIPANINVNEPISIYGIDYENRYSKISDVVLTNGVFNNKLISAQNTSIEVKNKTSNRSSISINMSVEEPTLNEIFIDTLPLKTNYFIGQELDKSGMVVKGVYSDGTTEIIEDYQISYESFVEGQNVITITYAKRSTTFNITARYIKITWTDEYNEVQYEQNLEFGQMPDYNGPDLSKDCETPEAYTMHWDSEITPAIGDKTYKAVFELKTFVVKFYNDTELLKETIVNYGENATYDLGNPVKIGNAQYSYEFKKWVTQNGGEIEAELNNVTENLEVYASFEEIVNTYTITFNNFDGEMLQESQFAYGATPIYNGETPTKNATDEYYYTFSGWSPNIVPVSTNTVYVAEFTSTKRTYSVKWMNGTDILKIDTLEYGALPVYSEELPSKQATAEYSYTFKEWSPRVTNVIGDATYTAVYSEEKNSYMVVFKDYDGHIIEVKVLEYGTLVDLPETNPTRPSTEEYKYEFDKWLNYETSMTVTGNLEFIASYNAIKIENITIKDESLDVEIDLDEDLAEGTSLKVVVKDDVTESQIALENKYENISNLMVYKMSLVDSNKSEVELVGSYVKVRIKVPENIDEKNLVIYNLTSQKTVSFEIVDEYAVCELSGLGEIALFNSHNNLNNSNESSNGINVITLVLIISNVVLFVVCIVIGIVLLKKKKSV